MMPTYSGLITDHASARPICNKLRVDFVTSRLFSSHKRPSQCTDRAHKRGNKTFIIIPGGIRTISQPIVHSLDLSRYANEPDLLIHTRTYSRKPYSVTRPNRRSYYQGNEGAASSCNFWKDIFKAREP